MNRLKGRLTRSHSGSRFVVYSSIHYMRHPEAGRSQPHQDRQETIVTGCKR
jgi:hypothetical protein